MAPPPATPPAGAHFLLAKRKAAHQTQTPTQLQAGPSQFVSTPRFPVSSTSGPSSNQLPPFSTPAPLGSRPRARLAQDIIDTSPQSPEDLHAQDLDDASDGIEVDSSFVSQSPSEKLGRPKRRRISISPELGVGSQPEAVERTENSPIHLDLDELPPRKSNLVVPDTDEESPLSSEDTHESDEALPDQQAPTHQHPKFLRPPRFKAPEASDASQLQMQLPDAFSPQRRGVKYLPDGLAAEVRDWLVELKGGDGSDGFGVTEARFTVDDVRSYPGMLLVRGHREKEDAQGETERLIIAGDGRITGLGGKNEVKKGSLVTIAPPAWDVNLDSEGKWTVGCDWFVEQNPD